MTTDVSTFDDTEFTWKRRTDASPTGEGSVVAGIDLTAMLHDAATDLIVDLFGAPDLESLAASTVRPVLRSISATFDAPLAPGAPVLVGATLGTLTQHSFELRTGAWMAQNGRLVAHGGVVFVVVDTASQEKTAVPATVVAALRSLRPAPVTAGPHSHNH